MALGLGGLGAQLRACIIEAAYLLSVVEFGFWERRASPPRPYRKVVAPGRDSDLPLSFPEVPLEM